MYELNRSQEVTRREREVAALVALGMSNGAIAVRLGISEETVRRHVSNIMLKLDVRSRVLIGIIAHDEGWKAPDA
ncbi:MAG: helix-turn-helix transcriptional regulator [Chloroflexi bacterium]|nr:helix-turn-helix transcriptional regulator [Chloroflexota bacterium]